MTKVRKLFQHVQLHWLWIVVISLCIVLSLITQFNYKVALKYAYFHHNEDHPFYSRAKIPKGIEREGPVAYAVFCTTTPNGESYRSYDFAYNLPLTALAWGRIGFKSIAIIIGYRCEWENDPALRLILSRLEERQGTAIFLESPLEYRRALSQTARIFVTNLKEFPGKERDYLITSDADLWPLRKEHFIPHPDMDIVLVHWGCCGEFEMHNKSYSIYPMSNIGATVSIWRQIMNDNHSIAYDSESILDYLSDVFGERARKPVVVGEDEWYMDQQLVSIRLAEWMDVHGHSTVYRVSDKGFSRVDRGIWTEVKKFDAKKFMTKYDSHLPVKGYLPIQQTKIKPLIDLMYGTDSWESKWIEKYNQDFLTKVGNWIEFNNISH
jgi:hypothetical protein